MTMKMKQVRDVQKGSPVGEGHYRNQLTEIKQPVTVEPGIRRKPTRNASFSKNC